MGHFTIKKRILIMIALPIIVITLFSINFIIDNYNKKVEFDTISDQVKLSIKISSLVHELQKERGMTAGFIGSKGENFRDKLASQRELTNKKKDALLSYIKEHSTDKYRQNFKSNFNQAVDLLNNMNSMRSKVDTLKISLKEPIGFYTKMNGLFLDTIGSISLNSSDNDITKDLVAYTNFLLSKERAGIERAVLSATFGKDAFAKGFYEKFIRLITEQDAFLKSFKVTANDDFLNYFSSTLKGSAVDEVAKMRAVAIEKSQSGGFGISPTHWFDTITKKINLLKSIEDHISKSLLKTLDNKNDELFTHLIFSITISAGVVFGLLLISLIMTNSLNRVIKNAIESIKNTAEHIQHASSDINSSANSLSDSASTQTANIEDMATGVEVITIGVKENDKSVNEAQRISEAMSLSVHSSYQNLEGLTSSMEKISSFSQQTSNIIKTIDEIAFQTNLLALNAAVEAARAGEHGLGFAVVAEEVRSLANRSAEAVQETASIIDNIISQIENGKRLTEITNESFVEIKDHIEVNKDIVSNILNISRKQNDGVVEIGSNIKSITSDVQLLASSSEELAATAEELYAQISHMHESIIDMSRLIK
jgi:methyl-accepting chemotaxis protein